jgi:serine protease inhibitor
MTHDTKVKFANRLYTDNSLVTKDHFVSLLEIFFRTSKENLDFSQAQVAADTINQFVDTRTEGLIKQLFSAQDIDFGTRVILINAIYFKVIVSLTMCDAVILYLFSCRQDG